MNPIFLSDQTFVDQFKDLNDGIEYVVGKWYFWDETWAGAYGPFDTEAIARESLDQYVKSL